MLNRLLLALVMTGQPGLGPHTRILDVELEKATLADVQRVVGPAEIQFNGSDAAGGAFGACFVGKDGTRLYFFSHAEMGGSNHLVGGWQLLAPAAAPRYAEDLGGAPLNPTCRLVGRLSRATASHGGLQLGMTSRQVAQLLGSPKAKGDGFVEYSTEEPVAPPAAKPAERLIRTRGVRVEFSKDRAIAIRAFQVTVS